MTPISSGKSSDGTLQGGKDPVPVTKMKKQTTTAPAVAGTHPGHTQRRDLVPDASCPPGSWAASSGELFHTKTSGSFEGLYLTWNFVVFLLCGVLLHVNESIDSETKIIRKPPWLWSCPAAELRALSQWAWGQAGRLGTGEQGWGLSCPVLLLPLQILPPALHPCHRPPEAPPALCWPRVESPIHLGRHGNLTGQQNSSQKCLLPLHGRDCPSSGVHSERSARDICKRK